ncbi:MAG: sulfate ABC transporter substrate-binding protein [Treponemataceae bacterium]|nr:sulfate ABC transporter substrate-binding protein [Treponemataceae bacterium]
MKNSTITKILAVVAISLLFVSNASAKAKEKKAKTVYLTNVSYDPTRELYQAYNKAFTKYHFEKTGVNVEVSQSHGGSGKQALEVANGNDADVVTLALEWDVQAVADAGRIYDKNWVKKFPLDSSPYTSTIVFLVRKGNPKNIKDWDDIVKPGIGVITPNPKTSGGARWNYLAAWAYAQRHNLDPKDFIKKLYKNVLVLDSGARGATNSFVQNKQGDVLLAWENEAFLSIAEDPDGYEIITPSISILAQPSVAIVDEVVDFKGTRKVAEEYLNYLYSEEAQRIEGQNFYRPSNPKILNEFSNVFDLNVKLVTINDFGGWAKAQKEHFADGAIFDQIYEKK